MKQRCYLCSLSVLLCFLLVACSLGEEKEYAQVSAIVYNIFEKCLVERTEREISDIEFMKSLNPVEKRLQSMWERNEKDEALVLDEWQQAYIEYLQNDSGVEQNDGYRFLSAEENDIPELIEIGNSEASGWRIVNYVDGGVQVTQVEQLYARIQEEYPKSEWYSVEEMIAAITAYHVNHADDEAENIDMAYVVMMYAVENFELKEGMLYLEADENRVSDYYSNEKIILPSTVSHIVAEDCKWEEYGTDGLYYEETSYEEVKEWVEKSREVYVESGDWESPVGLIVEMKDGVIVRVYTLSS